jgi:hypothetical protein
MCRSLEGVGTLVAKKALGAPEARREWCNCCEELGTMISEEVRTNPRYNTLKSEWNEPPPPPP